MLDEATFSALIARALRRGGELADVFVERRSALSYRLQDGRIHDGAYAVTLGVGIRVLAGEAAGYAYSDDLSLEALMDAADAASLIARGSPAGTVRIVDLSAVSIDANAAYDLRGEHAESTQYVALLERADVAARAFDPRVAAVNAHVTDELQDVWIAASDGRLVHDRRPMVTLGVQVVASDKKERGSGYAGDGGRTSIAYFDAHTPEELARDAARIAAVNAEAIPAPSGEMTMIVGAGGGGVLLHEADRK